MYSLWKTKITLLMKTTECIDGSFAWHSIFVYDFHNIVIQFEAGWQDKQIKTPNVKKIYFAPPLGHFAYIY